MMNTDALLIAQKQVARMQRSAIRDPASSPDAAQRNPGMQKRCTATADHRKLSFFPDYAALHPGYATGEPADSFIKVLAQFEKMGVVASIEDWQVLRLARNLAAHDYETDYRQVAQHFNALHTIKPRLYQIAYRIVRHAQKDLGIQPASSDFSNEFAVITTASLAAMPGK